MTLIMLITPLWCVPFSGGSRISQRAPTTKLGVKSYYFGQYFAESCMEMKEIRPRGAPMDSPMPLVQALILMSKMSLKVFSCSPNII